MKFVKKQKYNPFFLVQDMPTHPCASCTRIGRNESCTCNAWREAYRLAYNSACAGLRGITGKDKSENTPG